MSKISLINSNLLNYLNFNATLLMNPNSNKMQTSKIMIYYNSIYFYCKMQLENNKKKLLILVKLYFNYKF